VCSVTIKILHTLFLHLIEVFKATQIVIRIAVAAQFPKHFILYSARVGKLIAGHQPVREAWEEKLKNNNFWIGGIAGTGKNRWASRVMSAEEH
jgi:hypothetical protein